MSNTIPHKPLLLATAMGLAALSAGPAQALVMSDSQSGYFSFSDSLYASDFSPDGYNDSTTLSFNQFDSSLGTLTEVKIELFSRVDGYQDIYASGYDGYGGSSYLDIDLNVSADNLGGIFSYTDNFQVDCLISTLDCSNFDTFDIDFDDDFLVDTDGGNLLDFIGLGTFDIDLLAEVGLRCETDAYNCNTFANFNWEGHSPGEVKVTFTYDAASVPVPEPSTLVLIGGSLAGLGLMRRRRATRSG